jgi:hypothetical protein
MRKLNLTRMAIAIGVGAIDEVLERQDTSAGRTGAFRTWRDYGRIGLPVIGIAAQLMMPKYAGIGETVAVASLPLLTKSIAAVAMKKTTSFGPSRAYPRMAPTGRGIGARQPEFEEVRVR